MSTQQEVAAPGRGAVEKTADDSPLEKRGRGRELAMIPAVDIFEDAHQLTVRADMPGVSKESLSVQADRNSLVIEGQIALNMPQGMSALYADLQNTKYRRSFVLSGELETERISATLKDGLLTVRIPKRVEYRTRKIKVDVA